MKWEYCVEAMRNIETELDFENLSRILTERGQNGWELISVDNGFYYFKRPLTEEVQNKEVD